MSIASNYELIYLERVKLALGNHPRVQLAGEGTPSAVLVPIFEKEGSLHLLLTRRTQKVHRHKGEISFPGGVKEEEDVSLLDTVLREVKEELGLVACDIHMLGIVDDTKTWRSNFVITPYVGWIPYPYPFAINCAEIAEVLEIPLSFFLDEKNGWEANIYIKDKVVYTPFYYWQSKTIWGATARIVKNFCQLLDGI